MGWQKFFSGLEQKRRERTAIKAAARRQESRLQDAIEHVVNEINPKIRGISGYRKKLRPCVQRSLDYCTELVARVPDSIEVSSQSWRKEPVVRALFSGVDDLRSVFSDSREIHDFFDRHADARICHVLLSMDLRERTVLGMEMHGDVLKRDVKQIAVSFADHRVVKPSLNESELKKNLEQRAFENLIRYALEKITELVAARHSLEEQQRLMEMQLRVAQLKRNSLEPLIGNRDAKSVDIQAMRQQAEHASETLRHTRARLSTLNDYIDRIEEVLGEPHTHLNVSSVSMCLNEMNIKLDEKSSSAGKVLDFSEAHLGDQLKRILLIARFPRDELLPRKDLFAKTI
jgi:hypothetical protein